MTLHPIINRIRDAGPEWARWLCVSNHDGWWQTNRGYGKTWHVCGYGPPFSKNVSGGYPNDCFRWNRGRLPFAINLRNGAIHPQDHNGRITIVPQSEWAAVGDGE